MNQFEQQLEAQTIDRLVDDELSTSQRRAVLEQLEATPGAWRRCALAFLESQEWRQAAQEATEPTVVSPAPIEIQRAATKSPRWGAWLAIAAGLMLAFGLGRNSLTVPSPPEPSANLLAETSGTNGLGSGGQGSQQEPPRPQAAPQFVFRKPVLVESDPEAVPGDIQRYLNSIGQQAELRRGYLPVEFEDGRQGVVPMEEVNIVPVVNELY